MSNNTFVYIVTIMGLLGIPSIFSMTIWCIKACKNFTKRLTIMEESIKSSMRYDLIKDCEHYVNRGFISSVELEEWQNRYEAYMNLKGKNGVLENRYDKLLNLKNEE